MSPQTSSRFGRGLYYFVLDTGKLAGALAAIGILVWAGAQWAARDWLDMPDRVHQLVKANEEGAAAVRKMQEEVARLSAPPPFIEFKGGAFAIPSRLKPGEFSTIVYFLKRNFNCETTSERRWLSLADRAYEVGESVRVITSPTRGDFDFWFVKVAVPMALSPGWWLFAPILRCDGEAVYAPVSLIEVLAPK